MGEVRRELCCRRNCANRVFADDTVRSRLAASGWTLEKTCEDAAVVTTESDIPRQSIPNVCQESIVDNSRFQPCTGNRGISFNVTEHCCLQLSNLLPGIVSGRDISLQDRQSICCRSDCASRIYKNE